MWTPAGGGVSPGRLWALPGMSPFSLSGPPPAQGQARGQRVLKRWPSSTAFPNRGDAASHTHPCSAEEPGPGKEGDTEALGKQDGRPSTHFLIVPEHVSQTRHHPRGEAKQLRGQPR